MLCTHSCKEFCFFHIHCAGIVKRTPARPKSNPWNHPIWSTFWWKLKEHPRPVTQDQQKDLCYMFPRFGKTTEDRFLFAHRACYCCKTCRLHHVSSNFFCVCFPFPFFSVFTVAFLGPQMLVWLDNAFWVFRNVFGTNLPDGVSLLFPVGHQQSLVWILVSCVSWHHSQQFSFRNSQCALPSVGPTCI